MVYFSRQDFPCRGFYPRPMKFKPGDKVKILKLWPCESGLQEEEFGIFTVRKVKNNLVKIKPIFSWLVNTIKKQQVSGFASIALAVAVAMFAFIDFPLEFDDCQFLQGISITNPPVVIVPPAVVTEGLITEDAQAFIGTETLGEVIKPE